MSNTTTVRLSCFGIISAIEGDLRDYILKAIDDIEELPRDIKEKVQERYARENDNIDNSAELIDYLQYIDFSDSNKILNKLKKRQNILDEDITTYICEGLDSLASCRNRVCHSRPLESTDFFSLRQFCTELLEKSQKYTFREIKNVLRNLENRAYLSTVSMPKNWEENKRKIFNNLPMVEFDDTGFLGRVADRDSIDKLLLSDTRVITIVGEGGIGKTALAQRCLYDILDKCEENSHDEPRFDIVAWVTLKANELTVNGTRQINNAITDSIGLLQHVNNFLTDSKIDDFEDNLEEILNYMREFKILLCIDNLETISTSKIRNFLASIPNNSKVLITTRMALGELEFRYKLDKLDKRSSIDLIRNMAKILNVHELYKKNNAQLESLCIKLFNNPLLIRWYVRSFAYGANPKKLVNKDSKNFKDALSFCFENLYEKLTDEEKQIILVIACNGKPMTLVELRFYLDDMHHIILEEAIHRLRNSSMLMSSDDSFDEPKFILTNVADSYLKSINAITKEIYQLVKDRRSSLRTMIARQGVSKFTYEFDPKNVVWETNDQKICATYLSTAIKLHLAKDSESAIQKVNQAKELMPDFSECYRVHAFILQKEQPWLATSEYETAIEYSENAIITRYSYAKFLNSEEQFEDAIEQLKHALKIEPESIPCKSQLAFTLKVMGDYTEANSLYDEILSENSFSKHKKFRISVYDQASDCRRRMSEQYIAHKDKSKANEQLTLAIDIIERAIDNDDYDKSIIEKLCKTYKECISYYNFTEDNSINNRIMSLIDISIDKLNLDCLRELRKNLNDFLDLDKTENSYKIQQLLEKVEFLLTREIGTKVDGIIYNLVTGDGSGVSYGFVSDCKQNRYFFSRYSLTPKNILDQRVNDKNIKVCFIIGKGEKGLTAEQIEVIN